MVGNIQKTEKLQEEKIYNQYIQKQQQKVERKSKQKLFKYAGWGNEKTVRARNGWNMVNKQKDKTEELKRCATEISKKKK